MTTNDLVPIEAEGFHAFTDSFASDESSVIFLSMAGNKDALKAIRAQLFINRWLSAGVHDLSLLPRGKYLTITRALPTGTPHMAIYLKEERNSSDIRYALTLNPKVLYPDLYFAALVKHSAVPVHPDWKAWLYKRAVGKKEIESLTAYRMRGIKINFNDENLAEDISNTLKRGRHKKELETEPQLEVRFDSPRKAL
ncbi:MAG: hypothetical protein ACE5JU_20850 [Candidatus Binatia bacterium]